MPTKMEPVGEIIEDTVNSHKMKQEGDLHYMQVDGSPERKCKKRKVKQISESTENVEVFEKSKKQLVDMQEQPSPKKKKKKQTAEDITSGKRTPKQVSQFSKDVNSIEIVPQQFSIELFRNAVSENPVQALQNFLDTCKVSEDGSVVLKYLSSGGSPKEIVNLLSPESSKNVGLAACVFSSMQVIIMTILKDAAQFQAEAEIASRLLLNNHLTSIHSMLNPPNANNRKITLKLLTAMVSLSSELGRQILQHVTFSPAAIESISKHRKGGDQSLRVCFVHFVMSLLVEGNIPLIRQAVQNKVLLISILPGLRQDSAHTIQLVFTTLRTKLVLSPDVSKSGKMAVFNQNVLQKLFWLYEWRGPHHWRPRQEGALVLEEVPEEDRQVVRESVHEFLLVLCTSPKYGVVFSNKSPTGETKHNTLLRYVLLNLKAPWEDELRCQLIVRILATCPDIVKHFVSILPPFLDPRASVKWYRAVDFVIQLIEAVDPEVWLRPLTSNLHLEQLGAALRTHLAPTPVMQALRNGLKHAHLVVRHTTARLVAVCVRSVGRALATLESWAVLSSSELNTLRVTTEEHLVKVLPSSAEVLVAWSQVPAVEDGSNADEGNDRLPVPTPAAHMTVLLDVLLAYQQHCLRLIDLTFQPVQQLLTVVQDMSESEPHLPLKMAELVLASDMTAIYSQEEVLQVFISQLLDLCHSKSVEVHTCARASLLSFLLKTGLFDGAEEQAGVWVLCCLATEPEHLPSVGKLLAKSVIRAMGNLTHYVDVLGQVAEDEAACNLEEVKPSHLKGLFDQLLDAANRSSLGGEVMLHTSSLSPLLLPVFEEVGLHVQHKPPAPEVVRFVSHMVVHMLHCQATPEILLRAIDQWLFVLPTPVLNYIKGWVLGAQPQPLGEPFLDDSPERVISMALLRSTDIPDEKLNEEYAVEHLCALVRLTTFHLAMLVLRKELSVGAAKLSGRILRTLLRKLKLVATREIMLQTFQSSVGHPVLCQAFSPEKNLLTKLMSKLLHFASELLQDSGAMENLLQPFREQFVHKLRQRLHKQQAGAGQQLVQLLQLPTAEVVQLAEGVAVLGPEALLEEASLSSWGDLLAQLLSYAASQHIVLPAISLQAAMTMLVTLPSDSSPGVLVEGLVSYVEQFPHCVEFFSKKLVKTLLCQEDPTLQEGKLASMIVGRSTGLTSYFEKLLIKHPDILSRGTLVFPILSEIQHQKKLDQTLLHLVFKEHDAAIESTLLASQNSAVFLRDHVQVATELVSRCMGVKRCAELCKELLTKSHIDDCGAVGLSILRTVFLKANNKQHPTWLAQLLMRQLARARSAEECDMLWKELHDIASLGLQPVSTWKKYVDKRTWSNVWNQTLLTGVVPKGNSHLSSLAVVCDTLYKDKQKEKDTSNMFMKVLAHSEFLNVILSSSHNKRALLELLLVLVRKNPGVTSSKHIPMLLGAYQATLSGSDQLILKLLQAYEKAGTSFYECRPYLWGEAAINHYSVRSELNLSLLKQASSNQVLDLFDSSLVNATIKDFPMDRDLDVTLGPERPGCYDPAFLLPLFSHLLAPEAMVQVYKFVHSGGLALTVVALGSNSPQVRAAAYHVLARLHGHVEGLRSTGRNLVWLHTLDALRRSTAHLDEDNPCLAPVVSTFLARAVQRLLDPLDPLFVPLQSWLLAKPSLDLTVVPEFQPLFHSADVNCREHRHWILEVLRDGLKQETDFQLCKHNKIFKMLMDFYSSSGVDFHSKELILEVLQSAARLHHAALTMVAEWSLVPWLQQTAAEVQPTHVQLIKSMIGISAALAASFFVRYSATGRAKAQQLPPFSPAQSLLMLQLALLPRLHSSLPADVFSTYLSTYSTFLKLRDAECVLKVISRQNIRDLLALCRVILGPVQDCEDMMEFGCEFVAGVSVESGTDSRRHLKNLLVAWLRNGSKENASR